MKKSSILSLCFLLLLSCRWFGEHEIGKREMSMLFWNLENMFDCQDDPLTDDDEFTPFGERHWNSYKYREKVNRIWKIILSAGKEDPPELIGICEIENREVLEDIFLHSPFGRFGYEIIHQDSPDSRGIDVALIYDPARLSLISVRYHAFDTLLSGGKKSRDILEASFHNGHDSLTVFVNHWPSKYGGAGYSEKFRHIAAGILKRRVDSLFQQDSLVNIICSGDFNDQVHSVSVSKISQEPEESNGRKLILIPMGESNARGTIRYRGEWQMIDHFFLSENFIQKQLKMHRKPEAFIYSPGFLLENDEKYGGKKPFRTWSGYSYNGGISDHLPILLRFTL